MGSESELESETVLAYLINNPTFLDDFVKLFVTLERIEGWITLKQSYKAAIAKEQSCDLSKRMLRSRKRQKGENTQLSQTCTGSAHDNIMPSNPMQGGKQFDRDSEYLQKSNDIHAIIPAKVTSPEGFIDTGSNTPYNCTSKESGLGDELYSDRGKRATTYDSVSIHQGELCTSTGGQLQCQYCFKYFEKGKNLKEHLRIHTKECPYKCSYCDKEFRWRSGYRRHVLASHPVMWEERMSMTLSQKRASFSNTTKEAVTGRKAKTLRPTSPTKLGIQANHEKGIVTPPEKNEEMKVTDTATADAYNAEKMSEADHDQNVEDSDTESVSGNTPDKRMKFCCGICSDVFETSEDLREHFKYHNSERPFVCLYCSREFPNASKFSRHLRSHKGIRLFDCEICGKRFSDEAALKEHSRTHCDDFPFQCKFCNKEFRWKGGLFNHIKTKHKGDISRNSLPLYNSKAPEVPLVEVNDSQSSTEQNNVTGSPPEDENSEQQRIVSLERMTSNGTFETVYAVSVDDLERRSDKEGATEYCCDICSKLFPGLAELVVHLQIHNNEKPFKCQQCSMSFSFTAELTQHLRSCKAAKMFQCDVCQSTFSAKSNLKEHCRIHTNEFPYRCKFCDKLFRWRGGLYSHVEKRHPDLCKGRKISACEMRNNSASMPKDSIACFQTEPSRIYSDCELNSENAEHGPVMAGKASDAKRYQCTICNSMFSGKAHLKEHQRIHTMENPYRCKFCQREFRWRSGLYTHVRRAHKEESNGIKISVSDMRNVGKTPMEVVTFELLTNLEDLQHAVTGDQSISVEANENDIVMSEVSAEIESKGEREVCPVGDQPENIPVDSTESLHEYVENTEKEDIVEFNSVKASTASGVVLVPNQNTEISSQKQQLDLLTPGSLLYFQVTPCVEKQLSATKLTYGDNKAIVTAPIHHEEVIDTD